MVLDQGYDWQVRITVAGVDFTSVGCESKQEAQILMQNVKRNDAVQHAEVERRD